MSFQSIPGPTYLFIDGAYLRARYDEAMARYLGQEGKIDFEAVRATTGNAHKVFYYDCIDDLPHDGESEGDLKTRIAAQEGFFEQLDSLPGYHVRLGSLSGAPKKRRQKKVDILLAVEMLEHAFHKNMNRAVLLAGDLDFAPLVDVVTRLGIWVEVSFVQGTAARGLLTAADSRYQLSFSHLYGLSHDTFKKTYPLPQIGYAATNPCEGWTPLKRGIDKDGNEIRLLRRAEYYLLAGKNDSRQTTHMNAEILERYYVAHFGPITWA